MDGFSSDRLSAVVAPWSVLVCNASQGWFAVVVWKVGPKRAREACTNSHDGPGASADFKGGSE